MPIVADAAVAVRGDLSKFKKDLTGADGQVKSLGQRIEGALNPKNLAGGLAAAFLGSQVVQVIGDATNAAAEFQDSVSATGVIFGEEAIPQMEAWADKAHEAFGASKQDALEAANQFAVFGKSAGLVGDDLTKFSQSMVQLGGDLASFFGGTTQEAITAVGAALRGESEPIRRYGVLLDDATLRQRAFEMGIISTTKNALTPQQRVLAAQQEILAQTVDAQGDFVRTSDGMANQQRALAAELENVNIELGEKLLPVMVELVNWVNDEGIPALRALVDSLDEVGVAVGGALEFFTPLGGLLEDTGIVGDVQGFNDAIEELGVTAEQTSPVFDQFDGDVHKGVQALRSWADAGITFEEGLASLKSGTGLVQQFHDDLMAAGGNIDSAAAEMADGIPEAMEDAKEEAEEIAKQTPGALANQLRAGIDDYDEAIDELADVAENSVSDLSERQKIEGILASKELTDALNSDSTRTRLLAADLVDDLVSDYELIAPGALAAGQLVNPKLADGIDSNVNLARDASQRVRNAAGDPLASLGPAAYGWGRTLSDQFIAGMSSRIVAMRQVSIALGEAASVGLRLRSPAEEGPLSEPADSWGRKLGEDFASGMTNSIPAVREASLAMAAAATLSPGAVSLNPPTPVDLASSRRGLGNTYIVNVNGVQRTVSTAAEAMQALKDLAVFSGDGRLTGG